MIDTMSKAHDEDVAGWILRPHFDSANKGKIVRNPTNQDKNLKCPTDESKTIRKIVLRHDNYHALSKNCDVNNLVSSIV